MEHIITPQVLAQICRRSENGEGVEAVLKDMKLPAGSMEWIRDHHSGEIRAAKKIQLRRRERKEIA